MQLIVDTDHLVDDYFCLIHTGHLVDDYFYLLEALLITFVSIQTIFSIAGMKFQQI